MDNMLAYKLAELAAAQARVAGMTAENMQRQVMGMSMAYGEKDFNQEAAYMQHLAEAMRT